MFLSKAGSHNVSIPLTYVKLHGDFQENKLSRETPNLTARKYYRR